MPASKLQQRLDSGTRVRPGRVLVVDHDPSAARVMAEGLAIDHIVTVADGPGDALARIACGESFDVVLCAAVHPIVSGIQMHRRLGAVAPAEAARIVFLTEPGLSPDEGAYLERLPNARIEKPVDLEALRSLVIASLRDSWLPARADHSRTARRCGAF